MTGLAVAGAQWRLKPDQRQRLIADLLPWALRAGTRCHDLMCIHYEEHFSVCLQPPASKPSHYQQMRHLAAGFFHDENSS